jgi:hypothetical protein
MIQVKEVLRRWSREDERLPSIAAGASVDRKTARRYVKAASALGLDRDGGEGPAHRRADRWGLRGRAPGPRPNGHGAALRIAVCPREGHHGAGGAGPHRGQDRRSARLIVSSAHCSASVPSGAGRDAESTTVTMMRPRAALAERKP